MTFALLDLSHTHLQTFLILLTAADSLCQTFSISRHLLNQNFFDLNLQMLGSLLFFENSNLLVVTLKKSGLVLALLLTWKNFLNLLLPTTTRQSSKPRNFTTLLCYHQIWQIQKNSGTQSTNYYTELQNHFRHLSIWIPYLSHLLHIFQI